MALTLPSASAVSGVALRPGGVPNVEDRSGLAEGVAGIARGIDQVAGAADQIAGRERDRENAVDLARAEAFKTRQFLGIQNEFSTDPDYATFGARAEGRIGATIQKAADLIRDPRMRERWLAQAEEGQLVMLDSILDLGTSKKQDAERGALITSLNETANLISDPSVDPLIRDKAEKDIRGAIYMGVQTGILSAERAAQLSDIVNNAENSLAFSIAETDLANGRYSYVAKGMAIPGADTGQSVLTAQAAANGGVPVPLDYELAKVIAKEIGDTNLPENEKDAAAYLSGAAGQDYAEAAQSYLMSRYQGDIGAVVIAMDPNGGTALADKWMASDHDEVVLPRPVKERYRKVMGSLTAQQPYTRIPIVTDGVDVRTISLPVLERFERLQSTFGEALVLIPGNKSGPMNDRSVSFDVSKLDDAQKAQLIQMASAMGFTGIGIGKNSIKLDATGKAHAWNEDGGNVPAWATDVIDAHLAGKAASIPALTAGVAPEYAKLTYPQRLQLYGKAKAGMAQSELNLKTSLQSVIDNAPAALAATGKYDGVMPTSLDFVQAYGSVEGMKRWQAFERGVDASKLIFQMKTMSNQDIENAVKKQAPLTSGNTAAIDAQRYSAVAEAAQSTLKAREADPAGAAMGAFPAVKAAFDAAAKDQKQLPAAYTAMIEAQRQLGIAEEDIRLLPSGMAAAVAATFGDKAKPAQERIGAVAGLVLATSDPAQQDAIFRQMVEAGLPPMLAAPLDAMRRGDQQAAAALMKAALIDPKDLMVKTAVSDEDIKTSLFSDVFETGEIGDIVYGLGGGADGDEQAAAASDLMFRYAKQAIIDGKAQDAPTAVRLAKEAVFGDQQVINSPGAQITLPKDADAGVVQKGLGRAVPSVRSALEQAMVNHPLMKSQPGLIPTWAVSLYADAVISEGYFRNADGMLPSGQKGFVFYNPKIDAPINGTDGKPMVFTLDQVTDMGTSSQGPISKAAGGGGF